MKTSPHLLHSPRLVEFNHAQKEITMPGRRGRPRLHADPKEASRLRTARFRRRKRELNYNSDSRGKSTEKPLFENLFLSHDPRLKKDVPQLTSNAGDIPDTAPAAAPPPPSPIESPYRTALSQELFEQNDRTLRRYGLRPAKSPSSKENSASSSGTTSGNSIVTAQRSSSESPDTSLGVTSADFDPQLVRLLNGVHEATRALDKYLRSRRYV